MPSFVDTGYQCNPFGGLERFPESCQLGVYSDAIPHGTAKAYTPGNILLALMKSYSVGPNPSLSDNNFNAWTQLQAYPGGGQGIGAWIATANSNTSVDTFNFAGGAAGANSFYSIIELPSGMGAYATGYNSGNSGVATCTVGSTTLSLNLQFNGAWQLFMIQWAGLTLAFLDASLNYAGTLPAGWTDVNSAYYPSSSCTGPAQGLMLLADVPPCQLTVTPSVLSFSGQVGGANPASQNVAVANVGGGGSVAYTFTSNQSWLTPASGSGTTPGNVAVAVNTSGLANGTYAGRITFGGACGSPVVVVFLTVTTPCVVLDQNGNTISTFIPDLSLNITPSTALYTNPIPSSRINFYETTNEGRNAIVMDFDSGSGLYARDLGTIFSWPVAKRTELYVWQPSLIEQPEGIYGRGSDWDDGGTPGNKFIQGVMVEADSFNVAKTFFLQDSDTLTLHALNECPVTFNQQTEKAFSCAPFTAHSCRVISTDGIEWRVWSAKLVFQPWPEATLNWQTELTSLGLVGWGHAREMNIPHVSTADLTLVLTFDAWPAIIIRIPNSGGTQQKTKITLPPNKFKLVGFRIYSTQSFNLFSDDMELKLGQWGRQGSYEVLKPFGGKSRTGAIV